MFTCKCGAAVPDGCQFCMECGAKVDTSTAIATDSAVAVKAEKKRINKKVLIPAVAVAAVILVALAVVFIVKSTAKKNEEYFANIPWGTDIETVQKEIEKKFECEATLSKRGDFVLTSLKNYDGMQGVEAFTTFWCEYNETLNRVNSTITVKTDSEYTLDEVADELIEKYNKLFGEAVHSDGTLVWNTENSRIELSYFPSVIDRIIINYKEK